MGESKLASFTLGFVLGAAIGTALAMLLAPARGKETRQRLRSQGHELSGRGREAARRALAQSKEATARGRARLTSTVEKMKTRLRPEGEPGESLSGEGAASSGR